MSAQANSEHVSIQATEARSLGAPATSTALITLFEKAADHLEPHELEYMTRLDEAAILEVENLSSTLMDMGCFFCNAEQLEMPVGNGISSMFFSLAHQMSTLRGLMFVAGEARFKLEQLKDGTNEQ